uniref:Uncharacterized protein n=1 Tax=Oryza punctata TaxID=4537 RepID=A0A0E0JIX9_ORYPU
MSSEARSKGGACDGGGRLPCSSPVTGGCVRRQRYQGVYGCCDRWAHAAAASGGRVGRRLRLAGAYGDNYLRALTAFFLQYSPILHHCIVCPEMFGSTEAGTSCSLL